MSEDEIEKLRADNARLAAEVDRAKKSEAVWRITAVGAVGAIHGTLDGTNSLVDELTVQRDAAVAAAHNAIDHVDRLAAEYARDVTAAQAGEAAARNEARRLTDEVERLRGALTTLVDQIEDWHSEDCRTRFCEYGECECPGADDDEHDTRALCDCSIEELKPARAALAAVEGSR